MEKKDKKDKRTKVQKNKSTKGQKDKRTKGQMDKRFLCVFFFFAFVCLFVVALLSKGTVYDISKYKTFLTKYDNIKMAQWQFLRSLG